MGKNFPYSRDGGVGWRQISGLNSEASDTRLGRGFRGNWTNCIWSKKRCKSTMGTFHFILIPSNSGNFSWDVYGTHILWAFHWKIPGNEWTFEKVVPFPAGTFGCKCMFHLRVFWHVISCSGLFTAITVPPSWIWWQEHKRRELEWNGTCCSLCVQPPLPSEKLERSSFPIFLRGGAAVHRLLFLSMEVSQRFW